MTGERDENRDADESSGETPTEGVPVEPPTERVPVEPPTERVPVEPPTEVAPAGGPVETPPLPPAASDVDRPADVAPPPPPAPDERPVTEKPRRNVVPLAIAGAVLLVALGIGAFFLFGGKGRPETPGETLQAFYTELTQGNCEKAAEFFDPRVLPQAQLCRDVQASRRELGTFRRIKSSRVRGNQADVVFEFTRAGVTDSRIAEFRKTEEGWIISGGNACYAAEAPQVPTEDANQVDALEPVFPPTYGPHPSGVTDAGTVYDEPQPTDELVHAMYHGGVVFWWQPNLSPQLKEKARNAINELFREGYADVIVTPAPELRVPFAMTAWGHRQQCVGIEEDSIREFAEQFYASGEREGYIACLFGSEKTRQLPRCQERLSDRS